MTTEHSLLDAVSSSQYEEPISAHEGVDPYDEESKAHLAEDEEKRHRNRISVKKCRHKKRVRTEGLMQERKMLTEENNLLRSVSEDSRTAAMVILTEIAELTVSRQGELLEPFS